MLKVCPESSVEASVLSPNVLRVEADSPTPRPMRQENVLSTPTDGVLRLRSGVAAEAGECPEWVLRLRPGVAAEAGECPECPTRQENVLSARRARRMS